MSIGKIIAQNKKARHDYFLEELIETGIELTGTEIKSLRKGGVNLRDSFAKIENGEVFVYNMHISPYEQGNRYNTDPLLPKKLLLHKREIGRLLGVTTHKGLALIPPQVYFNPRGRAKLELAVARGKKIYDKREDIARRDAARDMERQYKNR